MSRPTASSFLCNSISSIFLLIMTSPSPVNYFRSANRTRLRAYKNIFDFYYPDKKSDWAFRVLIWGSCSHISSRISFSTPSSIFYCPWGMKK